MRTRVLLMGLALAIFPVLAATRTSSPAVPLDKALTMPAAELAALCNRATASRRYVDLARAGGTVNIGGRRVTARNADAVAAEFDVQIDVCRAAVATRGVADIAGAWSGSATGCERAGSLLADAVTQARTLVSFKQDGIALMMTVSGKTAEGGDFSFPAPGTVVEHYIAVLDPMNSDYVLEGEATDVSIVLHPDTRSILAAWPGWANPPKPVDLDSCQVMLHRSSAASIAVAEPATTPDPYRGIPSGTSAFIDPAGALPRAQAQQLERTLQALWKQRQMAIAVLVVDTIAPESVEAYAQRVANAWGTGGARGGALLVLVRSDKSAHLRAGGDEAKSLTPEVAATIVERDVLPRMTHGQEYDAINAGIAAIVTVIDGARIQR